ncbi:MAG TPA: SUMF1/EgtB/PvdO family nonheme iron enzyme [Bacteroidales bacterium]|nr:SUMF1/EgtB/PvdO family nonheme iron enzyme [Bacteroidales bacterium]HNQ83103.1 SUMF1/EgtB/PvdO family nonheme iron enzyme [Bacteroidales bacterium]HOX78303.1 SUMF1/EgtB/PvdO family nonheme iron enzyme [Bacteroidales bacterium]HPI85805.1 SUMF1/EgtB/PvdO family nonheme iron enzyme [Bacteroidales bacterium]HPM92275.1 SUMF1/EgtB/PvdO family nonheme iron enzyme [Bacteroidales bacterium]
MKRLPAFLLILALSGILISCGDTGNGELVGVSRKTRPFFQADPYGMVFIPQGSFTMGVGDQDKSYGFIYEPKTVSVASFYMDETEITNDEYRQFVNWVKDSIALRKLGDIRPDEYLIQENPKTGEIYDPPFLNWSAEIDWESEEQDIRDALEEMYVPEHERYFRKKELDTRQLFYEYYWIDYVAAARKDWSEEANTEDGAFANRPQGRRDRSVYIRKERLNVYPDTLSWIYDYTYSFNDPQTKSYFWHPAYNFYPVVGINWKQARAFCIWRTELLNSKMDPRKGEPGIVDFRLPTETEWEWAARGGYNNNPYPWGGPYTRNERGCFLANFKPLRGNYIDDGGLRTVIVAHYPPNDFGLYDIAGNVSEWTNTAFDPSTYNFTWDMNPNYTYNAKEDDPPALKRKVVRGGSWKDIAYFMQVSTRDYEYQDTAKSYLGFRCILPYLGRNKDDNPARASRVYN